jgi:SAM-dependent methyltransferase
MTTTLEPVRPISVARTSPIPAVALLQIIGGYWQTQMVHVAASLGIADILADGPQSARMLAAASGCSAGGIGRLLRCLAGMGVFHELPDGSFEQNTLSELLRRDIPGSLRALALMNGQPWHWHTWGELESAILSEESPFARLFGKPIYEYLHEQPELRHTFEQAMSAFTLQSNLLALQACPLGDVGHVIDVGGGYGTLLIHLLQTNPDVSATLFERGETIAGATAAIAEAGLDSRCTCVAGDFFAGVPEGGDVYVLSMVISDWDDDAAVAILGNCRKAMAPGSRLLVLQMVLDEANKPSFAKELDLYCLVMTGGRERSEEEYRRLFLAAGLRLEQVHPSLSPVRAVEGVAL